MQLFFVQCIRNSVASYMYVYSHGAVCTMTKACLQCTHIGCMQLLLCGVLAVVTALIICVQIDNQLPVSLHPHLLRPIPPPPSVGTYGETQPACMHVYMCNEFLSAIMYQIYV